jgi:hypothetical protein
MKKREKLPKSRVGYFAQLLPVLLIRNRNRKARTQTDITSRLIKIVIANSIFENVFPNLVKKWQPKKQHLKKLDGIDVKHHPHVAV